MSHWKKKATQQSLISKGTLTYKIALQSPKIQTIIAEAPVIKEYCRIFGFGYIVTPQFKGICNIQSGFTFAYRYRLTCQLSSTAEFKTPNKQIAPITSAFTLSVA
jgi:hypothetical protein